MPRLNAKEQKELLAKLLNKFYPNKVNCKQNGNTEIDFEWGNIKSDTKEKYSEIYNALRDYRGYTEFAKPGKIKCDYVIECIKTIIEYDEDQHFTKAREITFNHYPQDVETTFDKEVWIERCVRLNRHDNDPLYRDEQRAFRDAIRDIEAYKNGYKLFRVYNGEYDFSKEEDVDKFILDFKTAISK